MVNNYKFMSISGLLNNENSIFNYKNATLLLNLSHLYNQGSIINCGAIDLSFDIYIGNSIQACKCYLSVDKSLINMGEYVTAKVDTDSIDNVRFVWFDSIGERRSVIDDIEPFEDTYSLDTAGTWFVEVQCSDGTSSMQTVDVSFTALPEYTFGIIVSVGSALTIFTLYMFRNRSRY